jgi:hypothetical protein
MWQEKLFWRRINGEKGCRSRAGHCFRNLAVPEGGACPSRREEKKKKFCPFWSKLKRARKTRSDWTT